MDEAALAPKPEPMGVSTVWSSLSLPVASPPSASRSPTARLVVLALYPSSPLTDVTTSVRAPGVKVAPDLVPLERMYPPPVAPVGYGVES